MELWIRSQDKERIIKVNNIFIHQDNNHLICANQRAIDQFNDESFELGAYSSRKRTLEVLDEIQDCLLANFNFNGSYKEVDIKIKAKMINGLYGIIYEMPEE